MVYCGYRRYRQRYSTNTKHRNTRHDDLLCKPNDINLRGSKSKYKCKCYRYPGSANGDYPGYVLPECYGYGFNSDGYSFIMVYCGNRRNRQCYGANPINCNSRYDDLLCKPDGIRM